MKLLFDAVCDALPSLADDRLEEIAGMIEAILEERRAKGTGARVEDVGADVGTGTGGGHGAARGWVEVRMVNGCGPYAYQRWYEGGIKKTKYIGKVRTV